MMDSWIKQAGEEIHRRNAEGVLASAEISEIIESHRRMDAEQLRFDKQRAIEAALED
jgi:hypothetical protein